MSKQIKMTDSELLEVRNLQNNFQQNIFKMGQNTFQKIQAENLLKQTKEQELKLVEEFETFQKSESDLINKLLTKYGEGSLDMKNGVFVSEESTSQNEPVIGT